jgi:two-component system alkaline phosphatase synthesis response regulator PhoP
MTRILLADDSPHAQRMGERILADEGFEVVTVSDGDSAIIRLEDVDPDVAVIDAVMPKRSGLDVCQYIRMSPRHRHTRIVLTAGAQETLEQGDADRVQADAVLRKPFEASALVGAVRPLAEKAFAERPGPPKTAGKVRSAPPRITSPVVALVDPEEVRAAITVALDASMPSLIEHITERVLASLNQRTE